MSSRPPLPQPPFLVVGLARSGVAAVEQLRMRGHRVIACDQAFSEAGSRLKRLGAEVHLNSDGIELVKDVKTVIKSPGVPSDAPVIAAAYQAGVEVIGELELGWRLLPNRFIAVTGTNGKTTTTELLGHIYRTAGLPVAVVGNVGTPLSSLAAPDFDPQTTVVCECSSFQLEDTTNFAPETAVLLNLAPDHLDRHGSFANYRDAKMKIFKHQTATDYAVVSEQVADQLPATAAKHVSFDGDGSEMAFDGKYLIWQGTALIDTIRIKLAGRHNLQNAMAAATAALINGVSTEAVVAGLESFTAVAHRLETVAEIDGVQYVNDSKATNTASTKVALEAFNQPVHLILGGVAKGDDFSELRDLLDQRCAGIYIIGEAAQLIVEQLGDLTPVKKRFNGLEQAVKAAAAAAKVGEVVLLSPACASYDNYQNYEQRGEHFQRLVAGLAHG